MGFDLDAFIGPRELLLRLGRPLCPLGQGLSLVPWSPLSEEVAVELSAHGRLAFASASYFAGAGSQEAKVWEAGATLYQGDSVNAALRLLGVTRTVGSDEWDVVGLGANRSNDAWQAAALMAELPADPAAERAQLERLLFDGPVARVRQAAAARLGKHGAPVIERLLQSYRGDADYGVRLSSALALAQVGAVDVLVELLDGEDAWPPLFALGTMGDKAVPALGRLIELIGAHPDWKVRVEAARTLGLTHSEQAQFALLRASEKDANEQVRAAALAALKDLKS